MPEMARPLPQ